MAHCVIGRILDTDVMQVVVACRVHCWHAPGPMNGEPASTTPIEAIDGDPGGRERALNAWRLNTHRQRPLLLHHGDWRDTPDHSLAERCWCKPERFEAVS
jgi:hypothetical protein